MQIDFLFIGPIRSGTTWIHELLKQYRQIRLPQDSIKETFFFDQYYNKGFDWYENFYEQQDLDKYIYGEVAPTYFISKSACNRIKAHNPDARIFINKRNKEDLESSIQRHYERYKLYNTKLDNYRNPQEFLLFDKYYNFWSSKFEDVLVIDFNDIANHPQKVKEQVELELGLDQDGIILPGKSNEGKSKKERNQWEWIENYIFSFLRTKQWFGVLNTLRSVKQMFNK